MASKRVTGEFGILCNACTDVVPFDQCCRIRSCLFTTVDLSNGKKHPSGEPLTVLRNVRGKVGSSDCSVVHEGIRPTAGVVTSVD